MGSTARGSRNDERNHYWTGTGSSTIVDYFNLLQCLIPGLFVKIDYSTSTHIGLPTAHWIIDHSTILTNILGQPGYDNLRQAALDRQRWGCSFAEYHSALALGTCVLRSLRVNPTRFRTAGRPIPPPPLWVAPDIAATALPGFVPQSATHNTSHTTSTGTPRPSSTRKPKKKKPKGKAQARSSSNYSSRRSNDYAFGERSDYDDMDMTCCDKDCGWCGRCWTRFDYWYVYVP